MKSIVLKSTGESLATPSQAELVNLFNCSPKVAEIFDFEVGDHDGMPAGKPCEDEGVDSPLPNPSSRKAKEKERKKEGNGRANGGLVIYIQFLRIVDSNDVTS